MAATYRPYQQRLVRDILSHWSAGRNKVVLAADVGAGKTEMAFAVIRHILPKSRVLVLTHNRKDIRKQFARRMLSALPEQDINVVTARSHYNRKAKVVIAIPVTIYRISDLGSFDVIIVDESHQFYNAKMVDRVLQVANPSKQLLLTATPSRFVNREHYTIVTCSAQQLHLEGQADGQRYFHFPDIEYVEAYRKVTKADYTRDGEVKSEIADHLPANETEKLVLTAVQRLTHTRRFPAIGNWLSTRKPLPLRTGPTLWIASSINHAKDIYRTLNQMFPKQVLLSESESDVNADNLDTFMKRKHTHLVVVDRATLAWDCPWLENLVDVSLTLNPECRKQQMGRITRPHPSVSRKVYMVVTTPERQYFSDIVQYFTNWLFSSEGISEYSGLASVRSRPLVALKPNATLEPTPATEKTRKRKSPVLRFDNPLQQLKAMGYDVGRDVIQWGNRPVETYKLATMEEIISVMEGQRLVSPDGKVQAILTFIERNGYRPSKFSSASQEERNLYQRSQKLRHLFTPEQLSIIENAPNQREFKNRQHGKALKAFYQEHGHWPNINSKDTTEVKLAWFRMGVLGKPRKLGLTTEFIEWCKGGSTKQQADVNHKMKQVRAYVAQHGHLPIRTESALGVFVWNARSRGKGATSASSLISPEDLAWLNSVPPSRTHKRKGRPLIARS